MKLLLARKKHSGVGTLDYFKSEFEKKGHSLDILTSGDRFEDGKGWDGYNRYIRWGCTMTLPRDSRGNLAPVMNEARNIRKSSDKGSFRLRMHEEGLAPYTCTLYHLCHCLSEGWMRFPVVVRPNRHFFSQDLFYIENWGELTEFLASLDDPNMNFYASEYVEKDQEFRVMVVGGRVVYIDEKIPQDHNDITWDRKGKECILQNVKWGDWNLDVAYKAVKACVLAGLDFCVVDVIVKDGVVFVLEVNTAPMLNYGDKGPYYNQRVMFEALYHELTNGKLEPVTEVNSWKDIIHPSRYQ